MKLSEVVDALDARVLVGEDHMDKEVNKCGASDLMSDVLANSQKGDLWVTLQIHLNIVAVASMRELAGIVLINGRRPEKDTQERAAKEKLPILVSSLPAFELIGRLYQLGVSGMRDA